jgi:hypothetical protein
VHNKTERRLRLDEQVLEFRENMKKWQEQDMRAAAENATKAALEKQRAEKGALA